MRNLVAVITFTLLALSAHAELTHSQETPDEPEVFQREYIVAYRGQYRAVQTKGANPCVVLALYSRAEKKGYLAHVDFSVDIDTELDRAGREFKWDGLEVSIAGGGPADRVGLFARIKGKAQQLGGIVVAEEENTDANGDVDVRLDLETGVLSHYQEHDSSTPPEIASAKIARLRFGRRLYRHQDSVGGGDPVEPVTHSHDHFSPVGMPHLPMSDSGRGVEQNDLGYDVLGNEF